MSKYIKLNFLCKNNTYIYTNIFIMSDIWSNQPPNVEP